MEKRLAHYTSLKAFRSIIENKGFWMTRSEFMNDPYDSRFLCEFIFAYYKKLGFKNDGISEEIANENFEQKYHEKIHSVKEIYSKAPIDGYLRYVSKRIPIYIVSFSEASDSLEIWNGYGTGGVQFCVDRDKLLKDIEKKMNNIGQHIYLAKVHYVGEDFGLDKDGDNNKDIIFKAKGDERDIYTIEKKDDEEYKIENDIHLSNLSRHVLVSYFCTLDHLKRDKVSENSDQEAIYEEVLRQQFDPDSDTIKWRIKYMIQLLICLALMKSKSYKYEKEVRLVYFESILKKNQEGETVENKRWIKEDFYDRQLKDNGFLCPYIDLTAKDEKDKTTIDYIKEVCISPYLRNIRLDLSIYREEMREYLMQKGFENITIDPEKQNGNDQKDDRLHIKMSRHDIRW